MQVNGVVAGSHLGGFTAFEVDCTELLDLTQTDDDGGGGGGGGGGVNNLTVTVSGSSLADTLASGARYAAHDLGGITRNVYLVAVPAVAQSDVFARTKMVPQPDGSVDWELAVDVTIANDGNVNVSEVRDIAVSLFDLGGSLLADAALSLDQPLASGQRRTTGAVLTLAAGSVLAWEAEHPHL